MSEVAQLTIDDGIGIITVDSPPVNALGHAVRSGLDRAFKAADADASVRAVVLICEGRTFFAGADISELGKPLKEPGLFDVFDIIENGKKPVIAAIHGTALGGGLELAMICHYRVGVPSARVGLPEVNLGLLPGAGGTQRFPRLAGVEAALDLMTNGRAISAREAFDLGVIDAVTEEGRLREDAVAFARTLIEESRPLQRVRDREDKIIDFRGKPEIFDAFRKKHARAFRGFKAPEKIIQAIEAAVELPFDEGLAREKHLFEELSASRESAAQRYFFFAERQTAKIPDIAADTPTLPVNDVGVIGAGTMGSGIAMNFLNAGIPVTLVEMNEAALDRGVGAIQRNYESSVKKGKLTAAQLEQRMALLTPALSLDALKAADLIVEAVFETMEVKREVFAKLDTIARDGAILASNTSFLDLDEIASVTRRPESVIGLHFFSPANVMRLLEVVRGRHTSQTVIATAMKLAKTIGKVPVLARVCDGFIANRLMKPRGIQADQAVLEGPTPEQVDKALYDYGFAMGPFAMMDLVGLDVLVRDAKERSLRGDFFAAGRYGQKTGGGFYDYDDNRKASNSPAAANIIADYATYRGVERKEPQSADELVARMLYPVVNEGAKILEEGIALRASDIDVAAILGYNWPVHTGGPMFWADSQGLPKIVEGLRALEADTGDSAFHPAALLVQLAETGRGFVQA